MNWRPMQPDDAAAAADLANTVHISYPEDPSVVRDRLALWPAGCFVLEGDAGLQGYFVCHPWVLGAPPALNTVLDGLPARPDCLYLHDIALLRSAQGQGHALAALEIVMRQARAAGLPAILLVAVGEAHGFWDRVGFTPYDGYSPAGSNGYGPEATAYIRRL